MVLRGKIQLQKHLCVSVLTSKHYKKALSTNHMVKQPTGTGVILYSSELQTTMVGNKNY